MLREGREQRAIEMRFDGACHRIDLHQLTGRGLWCDPQHELLKDAVAAYIRRGDILLFDVTTVQLSEVTSSQPTIWFQHEQKHMVMQCDFIAGCDGALSFICFFTVSTGGYHQ
jgi:p-hydroxybenzoate 3-monooxygenase